MNLAGLLVLLSDAVIKLLVVGGMAGAMAVLEALGPAAATHA